MWKAQRALAMRVQCDLHFACFHKLNGYLKSTSDMITLVEGSLISAPWNLMSEESIKESLQVVLCSDLRIVTVATFNREKLPSLPLASNPCVASRFHSIMKRFHLETAEIVPVLSTQKIQDAKAVASSVLLPLR